MKYLMLACVLIAGTARADFYVEGGLSAMEKQSLPKSTEYNFAYSDGTSIKPAHVVSTDYRHYDINDVRNPYGALSFGYDWRWRVITIDLQLQHQSSIVDGDHGQNTIRLNVRWYPFAH